MILIIGAHRTGSSLLGSILGASPEVNYLGELRLTSIIHRSVVGGYREIRATLESLEKPQKESCLKLIGPEIHYMASYIKAFPDHKLIAVIRDWRDSFCSLRETEWPALRGNPITFSEADINDMSKQYLLLWDMVSYWVEIRNGLIVKYEDIIQNTDQTIHDICKFIGINYTEEMLSRNNWNTNVVGDHKLRISDGIFSSSIGRYRKEYPDINKYAEPGSLDLLTSQGYLV